MIHMKNYKILKKLKGLRGGELLKANGHYPPGEASGINGEKGLIDVVLLLHLIVLFIIVN